MHIRVWSLFACLALSATSYGESGQREIAVLQSTDSSQLNLGDRVSGFLSQSFHQTGFFSVRAVRASLSGYTPEALADAYKETGTELISFAYVDRDRVALFLFDINRPGRYIATSETLKGSPRGRIDETWLDAQVGKAFAEMMKQYGVANFDLIPSSDPSPGSISKEPEVSREEKSRSLFKEMSKLQDGRIYVGASVGMARFTANGSSSSTVSVGGYAGVKLIHRVRVEAGADIFSYLLMNANLRFQLPIAERYVSLNLGATGAYVALVVTQNRGFNPTFMSTGEMLFGPSLSFDVPLLGASVRGDVRLLLGSSTIFLGTYGLAYAL